MFDPAEAPTDGTKPAAPRAAKKPSRARGPVKKSPLPPPEPHAKLPDNGASLFLGWDGTAHKATLGFRSAHFDASDAPALTYGGDGHLLTIAPTGAGKGVGAIIPALLTYPGSVIVTDVKGENYQVTARRRREMGQQVIVLDPFGLVTNKSDKLNPFDLFHIPGSDPESDAEMLAAQLAVGHEFSTDRYWEDTGRGLVSGLIADVATSSPADKRNLCTLRELLYNDDLDYTLAVALDTRKKTMSPLARDEFIAYLAAPSDKTRPCIRTTATTFVKCLGSTAVGRCLERSTFELNDLLHNKPMTIYLVLPPEKLHSHRALLRLWVVTLLTVVMRRSKLPKQRTLFLLDEAAQLGSLDLLPQAVSLLRGYGLQLWTFWQDLSQMMKLYPNNWEALVNNAAVLQAFGVPGHASRNSWRVILGDADAQLASELHPEEMLVAITGQGIARHTRANYLKDKPFAGRFDSNQRFSGLEK
ncbi:Conjugal transfer protein TraG [Gemmata sp. SH-PL17]|uniref:type IV secretory system conjugative DNA transfer family protein n=1 Tax=Gemmata sp. SH-PL17 TaxID=1630693 RepID=UPI00078CB7FC|nr:type IV secretory system conjugative DNA transfer family protein [Gemmata sp. SH-PL17]AMV27450.1 Conjugal transfer protein TraG [Gemmata sp. SH-PL17]